MLKSILKNEEGWDAILECTIYHTGIFLQFEGVIKDNIVYLKGKNGELCFPEEIFLANEECENGLIQIEHEGKWGFADIHTGEVKIEPFWDYAGPFYDGYAHVAQGVKLEIGKGIGNIFMEGGKHGYIERDGKIIITLEYEDADDIPYRSKYFRVNKNKKWGMIDCHNKILIPLKWDYLEADHNRDLIFCGIKESCDPYIGSTDKMLAALLDEKPEPTCTEIIKWGVYDQNFNLVISAELDKRPIPYDTKGKELKRYAVDAKYYLLKKKRKYGLLCADGRILADIEFMKKEIIALIKSNS